MSETALMQTCHVDDLVTDSAQRGKGFGAQILAAMKRHAKHDLVRHCIRSRPLITGHQPRLHLDVGVST